MLNAPNLGIAPSASEIIAKHLREAIIAGHFAEDEPIRQDDIAQLFNVSKIPVREALKRLEAEGLVLFQRNKGAVVTRISEPELAQMFEVRVLLEAQAIRLAVPNMDETTFARAEAICADFVGEDNVGRSIHDKLERYLRMQMSLSEGKQRADQEHREIVAACRAGDAERAAALIEAHIVGVCRTLYEHLPNRPAST